MKDSARRICCAFLLLGLALAMSVGVIGAMASGEEESYVWVRLLLHTDPEVDELRLFSSDGLPMQTLQVQNGATLTQLLPPGEYYAVTERGCTEFSLDETAAVQILGGCGRSDGEQLFLTAEPMGTVRVDRQVTAALAGTWAEYTLTGGTQTLRRTVRCGSEGAALECVFSAVPCGVYRLEENGVFCCSVTVTEEDPKLSVALP